MKRDPRILTGDRAFMKDMTEIMVKSVCVVAIPNEVIRHECKQRDKPELTYRELYDIAVGLKLTDAPPLDNAEFDK